MTESGAGYEIIALKDVDLINYEATEETEEYTISIGTVIYTVVDGALTEIESSELVVGDILVMYDDTQDGIIIIMYRIQDVLSVNFVKFITRYNTARPAVMSDVHFRHKLFSI